MMRLPALGWMTMLLAAACSDDDEPRAPADTGEITSSPDGGSDAASRDASLPAPLDAATRAPESHLDAAAGNARAADGGVVHRCVYRNGCLEFRNQGWCEDSNHPNCVNIYRGAFGGGACPAADYETARVHQTSCGETAQFFAADAGPR